MKAIGVDDSVNTCDCCGKTGLKSTVIIELHSGDVAHYGSVCATRHTGKSATVLGNEIKAVLEAKIDAACAEFVRTPEYKAERARYAARPHSMIGRAAADFVREASQAAAIVKALIAEKHGIRVGQINR